MKLYRTLTSNDSNDPIYVNFPIQFYFPRLCPKEDQSDRRDWQL